MKDVLMEDVPPFCTLTTIWRISTHGPHGGHPNLHEGCPNPYGGHPNPLWRGPFSRMCEPLWRTSKVPTPMEDIPIVPNVYRGHPNAYGGRSNPYVSWKTHGRRLRPPNPLRGCRIHFPTLVEDVPPTHHMEDPVPFMSPLIEDAYSFPPYQTPHPYGGRLPFSTYQATHPLWRTPTLFHLSGNPPLIEDAYPFLLIRQPTLYGGRLPHQTTHPLWRTPTPSDYPPLMEDAYPIRLPTPYGGRLPHQTTHPYGAVGTLLQAARGEATRTEGFAWVSLAEHPLGSPRCAILSSVSQHLHMNGKSQQLDHLNVW